MHPFSVVIIFMLIHHLSQWPHTRRLWLYSRQYPLAKHLPCKLLLCTVFAMEIAEAHGDFNCGSYKKVEFKSICEQFSQNEITVHKKVATDGLNQLRDSWSDTPGLHIIPGQHYSLQKELVLDNRQALLPEPSTDSSGRFKAIQLSMIADFDLLSDSSSLLSLMPGSYAGGIVVTESYPLSDQLVESEFSFVSIPSANFVELALSYFSVTNQSGLRQIITIGSEGTGASESSFGPVHLNRVLIVADNGATGLKIRGHTAQTIILTNSMIETEAIDTENSAVELHNSELNLAEECFGDCRLIISKGSRILSLESIFWSERPGGAIYPNNSIGFDANTTTGWLVGNIFSSNLTVIEGEEKTGLIDTNNYQLAEGSPAPLNSWQYFQQYSGKLGPTRVPANIMAAACSGDNKTTVNPETYQQPVSFKQSGLNIKDFASVSNFTCPQNVCPEPTPWGAYMGFASMGFAALLVPSFMIIGCVLGKKHRHRAQYTPIRSINNPD